MIGVKEFSTDVLHRRTIMTPENILAVQQMISLNCHVTRDNTEPFLNISRRIINFSVIILN